MRYLGGKARVSKFYVPIFNSLINTKKIVSYVEPFCGSLAIAKLVICKTVTCNDLNRYLIDLYTGLQRGWLPPISLSELDYKKIKANPDKFDSKIVAFAGLCGFGGKWLDVYARHLRQIPRNLYITKTGKQSKDYSHDVCKELMQLSNQIKHIKFSAKAYDSLYIPKKSFVYCDPPYANTSDYSVGKFDSVKFWEWVRILSTKAIVITSEHVAPDDFLSIYHYNSNRSLNNFKKSKVHTESLFIHRSQLHLIK